MSELEALFEAGFLLLGASLLLRLLLVCPCPSACSKHVAAVHGGLARAGKVRGQTPKVDPTVKAKEKRGRALKRIQYNKRFFSAVAQTGGRKRGPNAQVRRFDFSGVVFSSCVRRRCPRLHKVSLKDSFDAIVTFENCTTVFLFLFCGQVLTPLVCERRSGLFLWWRANERWEQ